MGAQIVPAAGSRDQGGAKLADCKGTQSKVWIGMAKFTAIKMDRVDLAMTVFPY